MTKQTAPTSLAILGQRPSGIERQRIRALEAAGWTLERLRTATAEELTHTAGIGWETAHRVVRRLRWLAEQQP